MKTFLRAAAVACAAPWLLWVSPAVLAQIVPAALQDAAYGPHAAQKADVYKAPGLSHAPIIIVVHGGGWRYGDKASPGVIEQKAAYWVPKGYIVVSINHRMLPDIPPQEQAEDLGRAVAWVQRQAGNWGGDPTHVFLMGHSSGGHMVALLAADRAMQKRAGAKPWRGSILLDGAGFDLLQVMSGPHAPFYDDAFGADRRTWMAASPVEHLGIRMPPMLLVCSTLRPDSCKRSNGFADKAKHHGNQATVIGVARNHSEIDDDVGDDNDETRAIAGFMRGLK